MLRRLLLLSFFLLSASSVLLAQSGQIRVDVTDRDGAILPKTPVIITNTETGAKQQLVTDSDGLCVAPGLQPGPYTISVTADGFQSTDRKVALTVGQVAEIKIALGVSKTETVEVNAQPGLEVETSKSDISGVVTRDQLLDLPVLSRGFIGLAQLLPGGAPSLAGDARFGNQTTFGGSNVRSGYSTIIDGTDVDHPIYGLAIVDVNQDAVQEFRVLHNQYDAEYSRAGTAVVDVITRSGTNNYDGMFQYFGQDQALNARNYFSTSNPPYNETHLSTTVGGPIIRDKAHFFVADEYLKQNSSFIEALAASNPFASQFNGTFPGYTDEKTIQAKVDYIQTPKDNFFLRYLYEDQAIRATYQLTDNYNIAFHDGLLQWEHVFDSSKLNTLQFDYLDQNTLRYQTATGPEIVRPSFTSGTPPNLPQGYPRRRPAFNDTFYLNKGKHSIKIGTRLAYEMLHQEGNFYGAGVWTFPVDTAFDPKNSATWPTSYQVGSGASTVYYRNGEIGAFLQDDIKLTQRLTVNAGLRYDIEPNLRDNQYLQLQLLSNTNVYPGLNAYVSSGRGTYLKAWQPRVGFAYDVRGNGRTVIRAAYGGYAARNRPFFDTQMQAQDSNITIKISNNTPANTAALGLYPNGTAVLQGLTLQQYVLKYGSRSMYLVGDNLRIPYIYEMTAGVEKALFRNTVLTVDGVRQIQTGLQTGHDANLGPTVGSARPNTAYSTVTVFNSTTSAYYSALQLQLKSNFKYGGYQLAYTWAKDISDGFDDNTSATTDPYHVFGNNDRGLDEENRTSVLALTGTGNLKYGFQLSGIVSLATGPPWNITYGSDVDKDGNSQDRPAGLPKYAGGQHNQHYLDIINAARTLQVATPFNGVTLPAIKQGAVTMGQLTQSDGQERVDLRLTKGFSFHDNYHLALFMEAYNLFNTPSFGPPAGTIASAAFLTRTVAGNPRQMQWGARFNFKLPKK